MVFKYLLVISLLFSCSVIVDNNEQTIILDKKKLTNLNDPLDFLLEKLSEDEEQTLTKQIKILAKEIADSSLNMSENSFVALSAIANLSDNKTPVFNNLLTEMISVELQKLGWNIVDYKVQNKLIMSQKSANYVLPKEIIKGNFKANYLLTGFLDKDTSGFYLTVKSINTQTKQVDASSVIFLDKHLLPQKLQNEFKNKKIATLDNKTGFITRN